MTTVQSLPTTRSLPKGLRDLARLDAALEPLAHNFDGALWDGACTANDYARVKAVGWQCMREIDHSMADGGWHLLMQELSSSRDIDELEKWETAALTDFKRIATGIVA